jgi:hypothetical protein
MKPIEYRLVKQAHSPHMAVFAGALGVPHENILVWGLHFGG